MVTAYTLGDKKIRECHDLDELRTQETIIETYSYYNLNILIIHDLIRGRRVYICEYEDVLADKLILLNQYLVNNNNLMKVESTKEPDTSICNI